MTTQADQIHVKTFDVPDTQQSLGTMLRADVVSLGALTAVRGTAQPGFHWTEHAKPIVGTDLCQVHHTGYVSAGRIRVKMADGTEREIAAGDAFDIPPGHDMWVISDEPYVAIEFPRDASR
ncbi:MAG TPA: cupin domain-containing protein [Chloroflexota bacterium]|nr:cupin domain-containing protein [Chloroflexota bacterium]